MDFLNQFSPKKLKSRKSTIKLLKRSLNSKMAFQKVSDTYSKGCKDFLLSARLLDKNAALQPLQHKQRRQGSPKCPPGLSGKCVCASLAACVRDGGRDGAIKWSSPFSSLSPPNQQHCLMHCPDGMDFF